MAEELLQEIEVIAKRRFGRPYHMLTPEEKDALSTAFGTERDTLDAQYAAAYGMIPQEDTQMLQTGRLSHANWGGALSNALRAGAGAYGMKKAKEGMKALSDKEATARRAAGDVGAYWNNENYKLKKGMVDAMRKQAERPPTAINVNQGPAADLAPVQVQGQQVPQPITDVNPEMTGFMQGFNGTMQQANPLDIKKMPPKPETLTPAEANAIRRRDAEAGQTYMQGGGGGKWPWELW